MPTAYGLPSALALWWFPLVVAIVFVALVAFDLNGSSSGEQWAWFHGGSDPNQLVGQPRGIRSDEWFVQFTWISSQFHSGFPAVNPSPAGGTDMTVLWDVPSADWTTVFRPQLWGYFFLGLGRGLAWHWWLPAAVALITTYFFTITINPRRPLTAAVLATASVGSPFLLWWWQTSGFLSLGWCLLAMTAIVWTVRHPRARVRYAWACATAFFAVTLALTSYVPFILSGTWVFILFALGVAIEAIRVRELAIRVVMARIGGFLLAGVAAVLVIGVYAFVHRDTLQAITGTVYPGQRSDRTGLLASDGDGAGALFGAPFNGALRSLAAQTSLGLNQSESAAAFMLACFLLPGLAVLIVAGRRSSGRWNWPAISVLAATLLYTAYLFVAHWNIGARLLFLDKIPPGRARLAFVVLLPAAAAVTLQLVDRLPLRPRRLAAVLAGVTVVALNLLVWRSLRGDTPNVLAADASWRVAATCLCVGTIALFFRRSALLGAAAVLTATVATSAGVVPIHRGVVDLYSSQPSREIRAINDKNPGTWVGTMFPATTALLVQSGVKSLSAVQSYPTDSLWGDIDPTSEKEHIWNRYAHLIWSVSDSGTNQPTLIQSDAVAIDLNPCSDFARRRVNYVLVPVTDGTTSPCLTLVQTIDTPAIDLQVLRVTPK